MRVFMWSVDSIFLFVDFWVQRAKHPRTKEIVNVGCKPVDVSDFRVQRVKHPRTREIVNVGCKPVDVSDFRVQRYNRKH